MKKNFLLVTLLASFLIMAGCAEQPSPDMESETSSQVDEKIDDTKVAEEETATTDTASSTDEELYKAELIEENGEAYYRMVVPVDGKNIVVKLPIIYFGFDKFTLTPEMESKLKEFSDFVKDNSLEGKTFHIGGHCDEWGADEYNIALGLKRAKTVENAFGSFGIDTKVTLTSFGESKPMCFEHNKACWQKNRRAEIKILP